MAQATSRLGWPFSARTGVPPTISIMSGIQCPAANGGSDHSSANTLTVGTRLAVFRTFAIRSRIVAVIEVARSARSSIAPTASICATTASNVWGSSEMTFASGRPSCSSARFT